MQYKIHKSNQDKCESGKYQILESHENTNIWVTCGIYYNLKDAKQDLKKLTKGN